MPAFGGEMDENEKLLSRNTWDEGVGSVYERIMLRRFFAGLSQKYGFKDVLEFTCRITKGYDNVVMGEKSKITLYDPDIENIKAKWKFDTSGINFTPAVPSIQFDLVWNFAAVQLRPETLKEMLPLSRKYVLVFVPNVWNAGSPFHRAYHIITRQPCTHAERGRFSLRTKGGLVKLAKANGINVLKCGFIDMPPIPDIGFSRKELKKWLGIKEPGAENKPPEIDYSFFEKLSVFEKRKLPEFIQAVISHHIYLFGEKTNG